LEELLLDKSQTVHLKPDGEICNRLKQGTRVKIDKRKGDWAHITWRSGKKKGWIHHPSSLTSLS
jgi:SH3-like domain-containing protein